MLNSCQGVIFIKCCSFNTFRIMLIHFYLIILQHLQNVCGLFRCLVEYILYKPSFMVLCYHLCLSAKWLYLSFFGCPGLVLTSTGLFNCYNCNDNLNSGKLEDFAFLPALQILIGIVLSFSVNCLKYALVIECQQKAGRVREFIMFGIAIS